MSKRNRTPADPNRGDAPSDADVFERAMCDVVRLEPDPRGRVRSAQPAQAPRATAVPADAIDRAAAEFAAPGVDRRVIRKLKRGEYVVDDRLDLHGMTVAEAGEQVRRFIGKSRHRGLRCVCVIHGRGLHAEHRTPVLKTRVREWLRADRTVLAFADAPSSDGGVGAVYVLLRR